MVFSSGVFLFLFLPIVLVIYYNPIFKSRSYKNNVLLIASLFFYAWGEPYLVLLLMFSILLNWSIGLGLSKTTGAVRKILLLSGIICDLGILVFYKYAGFLAEIIYAISGKALIPVFNTSLPIGISFFTFQALSYIIDVYKGDTDASVNPVNTALYISFFPQLIAGPIIKYRDINKQIEKRSISITDVSVYPL